MNAPMLTTPAVCEAVQRFLDAPRTMLIGKDWRPAQSSETLDVFDPATGGKIASIPAGDHADIDDAVAAARTAFKSPAWTGMRPVERERLILRIAEEIEANAQELAELECLDTGKPLIMAKRVDVRTAADFFRYIAGWATKIEGSSLDVSFPRPRGRDYIAYTRKEPVGVVGAIIPWNFPLMMAAWKIGPALATGCTIVLKPSEETPLTALRLGELILKAGVPEGVVNIVTGTGRAAGAALASHPGINKVAFTGSTAVGKMIGKAAVENMTRMSLELGGKSPVIVLEDADAKLAGSGAASAIFFNQGETCTAGSRLYVHKSLFENVVADIAARADRIRVGPGLDEQTEMGPLISQVQKGRVCDYIDSGLSSGARLAAGAERPEGPGYFVRPTVIVDTTNDMRVVREEIFGPVLVAMPFDTLDEVVERANDSPYGLGASIWSRDLGAVHRLAARIEAGTIWANCHNMIDPNMPFGGFKQSGLGREMGRAVIDMYTETKSICLLV